MLIIPAATEQALPLLEQVRMQRAHCTLFVLGDTEKTRELASKADVRAENHPYRKVVWTPHIATLGLAPGYERLAQEAAGGALVVALRFDFSFSSALRATDVIDFVEIERTFIKAERP